MRPSAQEVGRAADAAARRADVFLQEGQGALPGRRRADALKAALASVERKRQQAELQAQYVEQLKRFELPEAFRPRVARAAVQAGPQHGRSQGAGAGGRRSQALDRCGCWRSAARSRRPATITSIGFCSSTFRAGLDSPTGRRRAADRTAAARMSRPSASTTARRPRSTTRSRSRRCRAAVGASASTSPRRRSASRPDRRSTRRRPRGCPPSTCRAHKITMLPDVGDRAVTRWPRAAACPALSHVPGAWPPTCRCAAATQRSSGCAIVANLRHDELEAQFNDETLTAELPDCPVRARTEVAVGAGHRAGSGPRTARAGRARCRWTTTSTSTTIACASSSAGAARRSTSWCRR